MFLWRAVDRRFEMPVANPRFAAFAKHKFLTDLGEIRDRFHVDTDLAALQLHGIVHAFGIRTVDHRSRRHLANDLFAALAGLALTRPIPAILGNQLGIVVILAQVVGRRIHDQDDVTAPTAIATIRSTFRHILLPTP